MIYRLFGILLLTFSPVALFASEVMFEGYYRMELENKPIGYIILRNSFDPATNTFEVISFQRIKLGDTINQESTSGKSDDKLRPISFKYTGQIGDQMKMIDGTFKGDTMTLKINEVKKLRTEVYKIPKGTFLSSFLTYLLLQQKLDLNEAFKYPAVAEEDGNSYWGKAWVVAREIKPGMEVLTLMNKFKNEEFISKLAVVKDPKTGKYVKGEMLSASSPAKNLTVTLVASPNQATEGQMIPNKTLLALFGGIPSGKVNMVATPPDIEVGTGPKNTIATPVPPSSTPALEKIKEAPPESLKPGNDKKSGK